MALQFGLRQLRHAMLLDEERHFARAAKRANLSVSAFSRSIVALEQAMEMTLFDRGPGPPRPTAAGSRALKLMGRVLSGATELEQELANLKSGVVGDVRAGGGPISTEGLISPAVTALRQQFPGVNASIEVNHLPALVQLLQQERLDFLLGDPRFLPEADGLLVELIGQYVGSLYCRPGHPLARKSGLTRADLVGQSFACVQLPAAMKRAIGSVLVADANGLLPLVLECGSPRTLLDFVQDTDAILISWPSIVAREVESGQLRELKIWELAELGDRSPIVGQVAMITQRGRTPLRASLVLMNLIRDLAASALASSKRSDFGHRVAGPATPKTPAQRRRKR